VYLNGRDLLSLPPRQMRRVRGKEISMVFQEPMTSLDPAFTIGDQIVETVLTHENVDRREARRRAVEMLERVGIPNAARRANDYPHQFSGGMRQRVMLAIALVLRPKLVIADEPTTALDVTIQAEILDLLREMKAELGLSLLLITHDLGVIAQTADRVAVMYAGRIVEQAPVRAIFQEPAHPYTRGLLASIPGGVAGQPLRAIEGAVPLLGQLPPGCAFNPRCPDRFEPCTTERPEDSTIGSGHRAKCHLYDVRLRRDATGVADAATHGSR
jgi:oligopeptide/dipeptide ABC transporter ATP-binding protein